MYSLGFAVQRALGIALLPFYTRALTPTEYGTLGVLLSVSAAATTIFSAALDTSITRNYFQLAETPERRGEYISSIWRFLVIYPTMGALVFSAITMPFVSGVPTVGPLEILLTFIAASLTATATTLPLNVLRARRDLRGYLLVTGTLTIATPALTALFVIALDESVKGWFIAAAISNALAFVVAARVVPWQPGVKINWTLVRAALLFSAPLMPHLLSAWALQLADRLILTGLVSGSQLGVYSLASTLAAPLLMLVMALNGAFLPTYAAAGAQAATSDELRRTVTMQIAATAALTLACALLGADAARALAGPGYSGASSLVPWIVLGYGFLGCYFVPMNGATLGAGRRKFAWVATASSATTNVLLILIFVPSYGIYAAAVASAVGYLVLLVSMSLWAHRGDNPVEYDWFRLTAIVGAALVTYTAASVTKPGGIGGAVLVDACWLMVFGAATLVLGFPNQGRKLIGRAIAAAR